MTPPHRLDRGPHDFQQTHCYFLKMKTPPAPRSDMNDGRAARFKRWVCTVCAISAALVGLLPSPVLMAQSPESPLGLSWDPGVTDTGTQVAAQPATSPGSYYFRINTKSAEVWRTRLNVTIRGGATLFATRSDSRDRPHRCAGIRPCPAATVSSSVLRISPPARIGTSWWRPPAHLTPGRW